MDGDKLKGAIEELKRRRDELLVQVHLGKAEARDEWEDAEAKWSKLQGHAERLREQAGEKAAKISEASGVLAEELREAYDRIRERLKGKG